MFVLWFQPSASFLSEPETWSLCMIFYYWFIQLKTSECFGIVNYQVNVCFHKKHKKKTLFLYLWLLIEKSLCGKAKEIPAWGPALHPRRQSKDKFFSKQNCFLHTIHQMMYGFKSPQMLFHKGDHNSYWVKNHLPKICYICVYGMNLCFQNCH